MLQRATAAAICRASIERQNSPRDSERAWRKWRWLAVSRRGRRAETQALLVTRKENAIRKAKADADADAL